MESKSLVGTATRKPYTRPLSASLVVRETPEVRVTSPAPRSVWRELLEADPEAAPTHTPEWFDCICALRGYRDASRFYELSDGQQLLLPTVKRGGWPDLFTFQAALPDAWGWGGVISRYPLRPEDVAVIFEDLSQERFLSMSICPNPRQADVWQAAQPRSVIALPRLAHVIDLEGGFDKVWSEHFTKTTRRNVRKAERAGVVVETDSTGRLLPVFYDLQRLSIDRWARQQNEPRWLAHWRGERRDSLKKLEHIARYMDKAFKVRVAWHEGTPVAADIVLQGKNADDLLAAMDKERAAPVEASALLLKAAIEDACNAGCAYFNLGESGDSKGLATYKERFGGEAYPYNAYLLERLPLSKVEKSAKSFIKRMIGFKDAY